MEYIEEFDKLKTKVLKYIMYKKRTEREVRQKFSDVNQEMIENVIQELKELEYISDDKYIEKAVNEFMRLNNLSIKELRYKLFSKGLQASLIEDYFEEHKEELEEYELESARKIFIKKSTTMEKEDIIEYLNKKGYKKDRIKGAIDE